MTDISPEEALEEAQAAVELAQSAAVEASTGSALVLGKDDAVQTKRQLGAAYGLVHSARKEALSKIESAKAIMDRQQAELDAKRRQLEMELAPLQKQMARLEDGIKAVNLYMGTDEELVELRAGESAPADTPLIIRQTVLAMDEEGAFYTEVEGAEFDYRNVDEFIAWLMEDDANLNQVIPDTKGVVAIMPRRMPVDYEIDPRTNAARNEANRHTYWLFRNGQRVYMLDTDFSVGELLVPTRRSFTKLFEGLEPGTREWLAAEEAADLVTRHYMKVALILQGLVDRTAVFHPLPDGGIGLLGDRDYDLGKVVLIEEEEKAIGTGRQPFQEWLKERVELVAVGHRVVGWWPSGEGHSNDRESFISPRFASSPESNSVHTIHREDSANFYFAYERTDNVEKRDRWGRTSYGPAEKRASYRIPKRQWGNATFVPIDTVTIPEMEEYLAARTERHHYQQMFPALKAAIAFKQDEEAAESPFRALLAAALGIDDTEARELVTWWKTANKWHRPLNGEPTHEARAAKMIAAEHARRSKSVPAKGLAALHAVPDTMVIASRSNDLIAVVPEKRIYGAASVTQTLYVAIHYFTLQGKPQRVARWQTLTRAQIAKWTILGESVEWPTWTLNPVAGSHLTDPAVTQLIEDVKTWAATVGKGRVSVIKYNEAEGRSIYRAKVTVYWESALDEKGVDLEQPHKTLYIEIKGGAGSFNADGTWFEKRDWRLEKQRTLSDEEAEAAGEFLASMRRSGAEVPVPPSGVNYDGAEPASVVFTDRAVLEADYKRAATWADGVRATRRVREAENQIESALAAAWDEYEEETRRQRFIDDFGDAELWEDHKKSQKKTPFPIERYRSYSSNREPLDAFTEAVVKEGVSVAGQTVAEVLAVLSAKVELPEALHPVRFPETADDDGEDD